MRELSIRRGAAVIVALATCFVAGCQVSEPASIPGPSKWTDTASPTATPELGRVLDSIGADQLYVTAGDDPLRAGVGLLDRSGVHSVQLDPDPPLVSTIAGNGHDVVLALAGLGTGAGMTDAPYRLGPNNTVTALANDVRQLSYPTISPSGDMAAIGTSSGFWVLSAGGTKWRHDPRLRNTELGGIQWLADGSMVTVTAPNSVRARVAILSGARGVRYVGSAYCAVFALAAPDGHSLVTYAPKPRPALSKDPRCAQGRVLGVDGSTLGVLPEGWRPLAWAADSRTVLIADRDKSVAAWSSERGIIAKAALSTTLWMAAPSD